MAALAFSRTCRLCRISCISVQALCDHVMGEKHRTNLQQSFPEQVKEIGRVQYFLDTHLGEEPLLGLEYIVEEQLCFSYSYNCRLCNVEKFNWLEAVLHILDADHMTCYIDHHYRELSLSGKKYPSQADYTRDLRLAALTIYKKGGNKKIEVDKPALTSVPAKVANASPEDVGEVIGALPCPGKAINVLVSQPKVKLVKRKRGFSKTGAKQEGVTKQEGTAKQKGTTFDFSTERPTGPYSCTVCKVFYFTVTDLCKHIMGLKHRENALCAPKQRYPVRYTLQYILDTYVKEEPILGLEYIFEEETEFFLYSYTCQLCNEKNCLYETFRHILSPKHMTHYILIHHKELLANDEKPVFNRAGFVNVRIRRTAFEVQERYGRKKIQVKNVEKLGIGTLTPKVKDVQEFMWTDSLSDLMIGGCSCNLCNLAFESYTSLCHHLMQKRHRMNLLSTTPEQVKELGRLKYLLDMHLKDYPVLGLEYVVEMPVSCVYVYTCQLCSVKGDWCHIPVHLLGLDHLERYINKHHSKLSIKPELFTQKDDYVNVLRANAYKICKTFGRREIQVKKDGNNPTEVAKQPLQSNSRNSSTALCRRPEDEMSPIQEFQIGSNEEFLDYLNNFVIKDEEDALFMQNVAIKCTNALVRFGKELLPGEKL